jgi:Tol biopolymer transport system component
VQQVAGGEPVRVTHASEDDHEPNFSSDGSKIAFRSEREPPGVYLVSTLGGDERLIAPGGRHPRFSPDGKWIAYAGAHEQAPKIYIVAAIGGAARELQTGTPDATFPIWSPDGRHLLFIGRSELSPFSRLDWWVVPMEGGRAVSTGAARALEAVGLRSDLSSGPRAWSSEGVLFSAVLGGSMNLWRVPIASKDWRVEGSPERLTAGSGKELQASAAGKDLVFTSVNESVKLWSLPIDSKQGQVLGPAQRVTLGTAEDGRPSISADGHMLAYLSNRSGNMDVWLRNMTTGKEVAVTATPGNELHPRLTRDGGKLCYAATEHGKQVIYVASAGAKPGLPEKICDDCGLPMDWSTDGNLLVYWRPNPTRWFTIDVGTRESSELIPRVENDIHNVQYSPDGRWISFDLPVERTVFVTALKGRSAGGRSEWIRVSEGGHAWWSSDGNLLYFLSSRDGFQCLWAQRLELKTRQPLGGNFAVQHFHGARRAPNPTSLGWGLASDRFVLPIRETTGNVWLATFE